MSEQTKAERLADELAVHAHHAMNGEAYNAAIDAAAELRRLHAVNEELRRCAEVEEVEKYAAANRRLYALNGELLEALTVLCESHKRFSGGVWDSARAAAIRARDQP
jgi:hypothetical protein